MSSPTPPTVPATALSKGPTSSQLSSALVIGSNGIAANFPPDQPFYWWVVVSLKDLSVAVNETDQAGTVPASVSGLANNPDYFLFLIANNQNGAGVPSGAQYTFLQSTGSGAGLGAIEQMVSQLSANAFGTLTYVLGATMLQQDIPGFESWSYSGDSVLTMQFLPIEINGQWSYTPVQQPAYSLQQAA
jgi:hypothetical protein